MGVAGLRQGTVSFRRLFAEQRKAVSLSSLTLGVFLGVALSLSSGSCWADDEQETNANKEPNIVSGVVSVLGWLDSQLDEAIDASVKEDVTKPSGSLHLLTPAEDSKNQESDSGASPNPLLQFKGWFDRQLEAGAQASLQDDPSQSDSQAKEGQVPSASSGNEDSIASHETGDDDKVSPEGALQGSQPLVLTKSLQGNPRVQDRPTGLLIENTDQNPKVCPLSPKTEVTTIAKKMEPVEPAPSKGLVVQKASVE